MARRKQKAEVTRVEMISSATTRPILVPETHVARYEANGWVQVAKPKKATRKKSDQSDDAGGE